MRAEAEYSRVLINPICVSNQVLQTDSQIHETTPKIDVDYQEAGKQKWRDFFLYIWLRQEAVMDVFFYWGKWKRIWKIEYLMIILTVSFEFGHTEQKAPDPIRTLKLSCSRPSQYCGGRPRGNTGCRILLQFFFLFSFFFFIIKNVQWNWIYFI